MSDLPTCSVAGELVDTGKEAKCFADYMRVHALEATGGRVYAEMGRYLTEGGEETNDPAEAAKQDGQPVSNQARDIWVTETALATALYMGFFAESVSMFGILVAIALIIAGIGFAILSFAALRWLPPGRRNVRPRQLKARRLPPPAWAQSVISGVVKEQPPRRGRPG